MHPIIAKVFGFTIHSYGVMLVVAFFAAVWFARKRSKRFGIEPAQVLDAGFWALFLGIIGARLFFVAQDLPNYIREPSRLVTEGFQGLTSFGGVAFGVLGLYIWSRRTKISFSSVLDMASAPFLLAHPIGRIGCLLNGCCYGGVCKLPWAVRVSELDERLYHPAQVYDGIMNLIGLGVLLALERRGTLKPGASTGIALIVHGVARFIYEFWRAGNSSTTIPGLPLTEGHLAAAVIVILGTVVLAVTSRKPKAVAQ